MTWVTGKMCFFKPQIGALTSTAETFKLNRKKKEKGCGRVMGTSSKQAPATVVATHL